LEKKYVVDTNVIVHYPNSISKIEGIVVLTSTVLGELDTFKKKNDELSRNVRDFTRLLAKIDEEKVQFYDDETDFEQRPYPQNNDHKIISAAIDLEAVLVTNDILMKYRAESYGLEVESYQDDMVKAEEQYTGVREENPVNAANPYPNEYFNSGRGRIERFNGTDFVGLGKDVEVWGLKHKNLEQRCAIDALLDDKIKLVTLSGKAGTGKTLITLACALEKTITDNKYKRILVARPVIPMGNDIGYLPGDIKEKLGPWMQPIMDNLDYLFSKDENAVDVYEELETNGIIKIEPLTYIRGRSIPNQFIIIDEAQNLTKHEVKTIISRAGEGTKIILTGDPDQIDNTKLDSVNNGLSYVIEKFKDQKIAAHITLSKGERSELADIATEIL
jgi:PhoH-like ATPase